MEIIKILYSYKINKSGELKKGLFKFPLRRGGRGDKRGRYQCLFVGKNT